MKRIICLLGIFLLFFSTLSAWQPAPAAERNATDTAAVYTPRKGWPKAEKSLTPICVAATASKWAVDIQVR